MTAEQHLWAAIAGHRERLIRLARRRLSDADAEDCAHEAMLRVAAMPDVDLDRLGALLTSVTVRLCVDVRRHDAAGSRAVATYGGRRPLGPDPIADVDDDAEAQWLSAQVERLATVERAVVLGRADGRTLVDLAAQLGLSYRAVESTFGRARRKLRAAWSATACLVTLSAGRFGARSREAVAISVPALAVAVSTTLLGSLSEPRAVATRPRVSTVSAPEVPRRTAGPGAVVTSTPVRPARPAGPAARAVAGSPPARLPRGSDLDVTVPGKGPRVQASAGTVPELVDRVHACRRKLNVTVIPLGDDPGIFVGCG
jgi:RNA polymerase sigma factor (sigma-70 family)